ncbi:S8 family serine peptidase [bacterium]|nr:S8 family serine peptidase [bacterium]
MKLSTFSQAFIPNRQRKIQAETLESELPEHRPGELLVRMQPGFGFAPDGLSQVGGQLLHRFQFPSQRMTEGGEMLHLKLPQGMSTAEGMLALSQEPQVAYAVPNHVLDGPELGKPSRPDDLDPRQWGLDKIHAAQAWGITHGSRSGPVVAVFDTGVDEKHPDLKANLWTNPKEKAGNGVDDDHNGYVDDVHGLNPFSQNGDLTDQYRHGTHAFGIIGAVGNNHKLLTGLNWEAQIMVIKIFDDKGKTDVAALAKGMEYAARHGARVTSHSWGNNTFNPAMLDAFRLNSALHVCAAGNKGENNDDKPIFPASFELDNVISVASTDKNDVKAPRSNFGPKSVDLAAPGVDILSTVPEGKIEYMSGTSMAAPHVTGVAALIATAYPEADSLEIKRRLLASVDQLDNLKGVVASGGRLNAAAALAKTV